MGGIVAAALIGGAGIAVATHRGDIKAAINKRTLSAEVRDQQIQAAMAADPYISATDTLLKPLVWLNDLYRSSPTSAPGDNNLTNSQGGGTAGGPGCTVTPEGCEVSVGNVGSADQPNHPEWAIQSFGGMDSRGYWTEGVLSELTADKIAWLKPNSNFSLGPDDDLHLPFLPKAPSIVFSGSGLVVERTINVDASDPQAYQRITEHNSWVPVPILKGTKLASASIDGNGGVRMRAMEDGTQTLVVPAQDKKTVTIRYVLVPDTNDEVSDPHAIYDITRRSLPNTPSMRNLEREAHRSWTEHTDVRVSTGPINDSDESIQKEAQYMGRNFDYRLSPLADDKVLNSSMDFPNAVLTARQANCNTANTLLAISNPRTVNLAEGYLNSDQKPNGKAYLSAHDAHVWTVAHDGAIIDGTPGNNILPEEAAFFNEDYDPPAPAEVPPILLWGAGLAIASGGVYAGKKVSSRARDRHIRTGLAKT
jgi:hypothetical protein